MESDGCPSTVRTPGCRASTACRSAVSRRSSDKAARLLGRRSSAFDIEIRADEALGSSWARFSPKHRLRNPLAQQRKVRSGRSRLCCHGHCLERRRRAGRLHVVYAEVGLSQFLLQGHELGVQGFGNSDHGCLTSLKSDVVQAQPPSVDAPAQRLIGSQAHGFGAYDHFASVWDLGRIS